MTSAAPTILTLETDSAWMVVFVVSFVTLPAALMLRRLIARPGGLASGILLVLPLLLPPLAAVAFHQALLPEFAVLRPAGEAIGEQRGGLLHLFYFLDGGRVTPYVLWGSAGPWVLLIGLGASTLLLLRRALGMVLVRRLVSNCRAPEGDRAVFLDDAAARLAGAADLRTVPRVLMTPRGTCGAFVVGARQPRILVSPELVDALDDDELEAILAHEIAHIAAKDVHLVALSGLLRDVVAWNPLAHLAHRRLVHDREFEADRRAASMTGKPLAVASGLLKMYELIRSRGWRPRRALLAFLKPGGRIARRVGHLLAVADGRVTLQRDRRLPYLAAACLVAALGLQAGARLADDSSALVIVWDAPNGSRGELYAPKQLGQRQKGRDVSRKTGNRRAELDVPRRNLDLKTIGSVRVRDVEQWVGDMSRWAAQMGENGLRPITLAWEARQDWEAVEIRCAGGAVCLYRVERGRR
jgi:Zn-dependent protease with chaperone function